MLLFLAEQKMDTFQLNLFFNDKYLSSLRNSKVITFSTSCILYSFIGYDGQGLFFEVLSSIFVVFLNSSFMCIQTVSKLTLLIIATRVFVLSASSVCRVYDSLRSKNRRADGQTNTRKLRFIHIDYHAVIFKFLWSMVNFTRLVLFTVEMRCLFLFFRCSVQATVVHQGTNNL